MNNSLVFLGASILGNKGSFCKQAVCNQVATTVQLFAGLELAKTAIENYAPVSIREWTADYMNSLVNLVAGATLATVFANRNININKY